MADFPEPSSVEDKYRILLQVSQAANGELELAAVLEPVASALKPFVPVDAVAVVTVEHDHISGVERRRGESFADVAARGLNLPQDRSPKSMPFAGSGVAFVGRSTVMGKGRAPETMSASPAVSQNLEVEKTFPEDERLSSYGIRAYVRAPLFVRERLIGSIGLLLAGNFYAADIPEVARLIEEARCAGAAIGIDLSAVQVIDRAVVQFLNETARA